MRSLMRMTFGALAVALVCFFASQVPATVAQMYGEYVSAGTQKLFAGFVKAVTPAQHTPIAPGKSRQLPA